MAATQRQNNFWLPLGTVAAAIVATLSPNTAIQVMAGTGGLMALGATANAAVSRRRISEAEYRLRQEFEAKEAELRKLTDAKVKEVEFRLHQLRRDERSLEERDQLIESLRNELGQSQLDMQASKAAYIAIHEKLGQLQEDSKAEMEALQAQMDEAIKRGVHQNLGQLKKHIYENEYLPKINGFRQRQIDIQAQLKLQIEQQQQRSSSSIERSSSVINQLKAACEDAATSLEAWAAEREKWEAEAAARVEQAFQLMQYQHAQEIERMQNQIHTFLQPKRLMSTSKAAYTANRIADWYLNRNIVVDIEDAREWVDKDEVWVKTRGAGLKALKEHAEHLWEEFELATQPDYEVERGCVKITVYSDAPLDPNATYKVLKSADDKIAKHVESSDGNSFKIFKASEKLREFIRRSERLHFLLNGDSGSGKDALMNNFINLVYQTMLEESGEEIEIVGIDVKYPNDSPIIVSGKIVHPQYRGINDPDGDEAYWVENDSLAGLMALQHEVYKRLRLATEAADRGLPLPKFKKAIWFISELEQAIAVYGQVAANCVKTAARLGRSLQIAVVANCQSPNASAVKMLIADLNNFAVAYLRDNAYKGADERIKTADQRRPIKRGIAWLEKNSEGRDRFDPERFWALFKLPGEPAFLAFLPEPNEFSGVIKPKELEQSQPKPDESNPFELADEPFLTGEDELMAEVEKRQAAMQTIDVTPAPVQTTASPLPELSIPAQAIYERYQQPDSKGHRVKARWAQRKAFKSEDLRSLSSGEVLTVFQELAAAGFGEFNPSDQTWGELVNEVNPEILRG